MPIDKLTDLLCKRAKPGVTSNTSTRPGTPCAARLFDGGGLYLNVSDSGHKTWRQQYRINGAKRVIVHGPYGPDPQLSLAEARALREDTKRLLAAGKDPVAQRRASKTIAITRDAATVERYATEHYHAIKHDHRNAKHSAQWIGSLQPLFAKLGNRPLANVTTADLVAVVAPVIRNTPESGRRLRQRIRQVFAAALEDDLIDRDPAATLHTNKRLRMPSREQRHFTALPFAEVPALVTTLHEYPVERMGIATRRALEFLIHTATRTQETLLATWDEFDLKAKTWTIPGERMKMGRTFVVPLTGRALAILDEVRPMSGGVGFVFPSPRNPRHAMSNMALLMAIRRLGYAEKTTAHGLRSSFSDFAYTQTRYRSEVIEQCLAHVSENKVKAAYLRSDFMEDRRALMQLWADHVAGRTAAKVVSIRKQRA